MGENSISSFVSNEDDISSIVSTRRNSDLKNEVVEVSPKGRFYRVTFK